MNGQQMHPVYVWEVPVRLTHWINFLSILALSITGFYIGRPFIHALSAEQYVMGWMRFIHFVSAYVLLMGIVVRLYWALVGNKYANWRAFNPFSRQYWKELAGWVKFYLLVGKEPRHAVGHPALASFSYLVLLLLFIFEIISGFALYSTTHKAGGIWTFMGGWLTTVMNLQLIRLYHHLVMYVILAFVILHVYISWFLGGLEGNGLMSSIFTGYKFVPSKESK